MARADLLLLAIVAVASAAAMVTAQIGEAPASSPAVVPGAAPGLPVSGVFIAYSLVFALVAPLLFH